MISITEDSPLMKALERALAQPIDPQAPHTNDLSKYVCGDFMFTASFAKRAFDVKDPIRKGLMPEAYKMIRDFYKDEGIKFGAPGYDWTEEGAEELAFELYVSYH